MKSIKKVYFIFNFNQYDYYINQVILRNISFITKILCGFELRLVSFIHIETTVATLGTAMHELVEQINMIFKIYRLHYSLFARLKLSFVFTRVIRNVEPEKIFKKSCSLYVCPGNNNKFHNIITKYCFHDVSLFSLVLGHIHFINHPQNF